MSQSLSELWSDIAAGTAAGYTRDLAAKAGVSEGELVAAGIGNGVVRLDVDWNSAFPKLEAFGEVKVLTRNDAIVHEKIGTFGKFTLMQATGLVLNGDIDLRIFFSHWYHTFAVTTTTRRGQRTGLQVFNAQGLAIHKIYPTDATDTAAWDAFVAEMTAADQTPSMTVLPAIPQAPHLADEDVNVDALRTHWSKLHDVHHFHDMLQTFGISRHQAMRLGGDPWSREVPADALKHLLPKAAEQEVPIMIFVGNPGCIQIHTGPVKTLMERDGWYNVMDPRFTLHVQESEIASAFVVRKPMQGGIITTVELYTPTGENVAILCGQRDAGTPERAEWIALTESLPTLPATQAA